MFFRKSKRIKQLEQDVCDWKRATKDALKELEKLSAYLDATPTDCVRGEHCAGCANAERIRISLDHGPIYLSPEQRYRFVYVCGRGLCKNFKQRGENECENRNSEGER
jgi:hypothetical protein